MAASFAAGQDSKSERKGEAAKFEFNRGDAKGGLQESKDRKYTLKVEGETAQIYDAATNKPVGNKLHHNRSNKSLVELKITCWAFSRDGKNVATGAGIKRFNDHGDIDVGDVSIWEVPTGKLIASFRKEEYGEEGVGIVKAVTFSKDGKTIVYEADRFEFDGPDQAFH